MLVLCRRVRSCVQGRNGPLCCAQDRDGLLEGVGGVVADGGSAHRCPSCPESLPAHSPLHTCAPARIWLHGHMLSNSHAPAPSPPRDQHCLPARRCRLEQVAANCRALGCTGTAATRLPAHGCCAMCSASCHRLPPSHRPLRAPLFAPPPPPCA